jgi:hypothetical protein
VKKVIFFIWIFLIGGIFFSCAQEPPAEAPQNAAGKIFGVEVPLQNYYFAKRALMIFGTPWGGSPRSPQEIEQRVWENLILSYEAYRRDIKVSQQELEEEIAKTLKSEKVDFDWKKDKQAYEKWLRERLNEGIELFENQLRYLIQIKKLRQQVLDSIKPQVGEEEAYQEFLNEYNTLSLELAEFDTKKEAEAFYEQLAKDSAVWEQKRKSSPKIFKKPGFVALEFLMDMWKIPKDDLYKMLDYEIGTIYPPAIIYGGKYAVFRILKKRLADKDKFPKLRDSYYKQIEMKKKYKGWQEWLEKFKASADIDIYIVRPQALTTEERKSDKKTE